MRYSVVIIGDDSRSLEIPAMQTLSSLAFKQYGLNHISLTLRPDLGFERPNLQGLFSKDAMFSTPFRDLRGITTVPNLGGYPHILSSAE